MIRTVQVAIIVALAFTACASRQHRDSAGKIELDGNQVVHLKGAPYFCFSYIGNGQERHQCATSNDLCGQLVAARTAEKFEMTSACREGNAVYCFAWAEGEASNSQCYETEPDCTEQSAETGKRVGETNVSGCQHFERDHQSF